MVSAMFDEVLKVEATFVAARYARVETTHETVHDLEATNGQEDDKVIEDFLMRISTNSITVEDNPQTVENKVKK